MAIVKSPAVITHRDLFGKAYYGAFNDFIRHRYATMCFDGGRGSLKSSFVSICIIMDLELAARKAFEMRAKGVANWRHYLTHAICYRKVMGTSEQSTYSQLVWAINKLGLEHKYICKKSPMQIVRIGTDQKILFRGLDDPLKSKGIKFAFSYARIVWFEETAEFDGMQEIRSVLQSVQRGGEDFLTFFTYNPPETSACWVNTQMAILERKDPTFKRYHTDYLSVPPAWLGKEFIAQANLLKETNLRAYRHEYLGEVTGNGGTVFPNVKAVKISDEEIAHFSNLHWGCDFGTVDPTVLMGMEYEKFNSRLIIFSEVYESNMLLDEMERRFKAAHFGYEYIRADCAAKQMIIELENRGLPMLPCTKGADSIMRGIKFLQNLKEICIDPARCPNAFKEFSEYEYEKSKITGEFTGRFPDFMNHSIDSTRYAVEDLSGGGSLF